MLRTDKQTDPTTILSPLPLTGAKGNCKSCFFYILNSHAGKVLIFFTSAGCYYVTRMYTCRVLFLKTTMYTYHMYII